MLVFVMLDGVQGLTIVFHWHSGCAANQAHQSTGVSSKHQAMRNEAACFRASSWGPKVLTAWRPHTLKASELKSFNRIDWNLRHKRKWTECLTTKICLIRSSVTHSLIAQRASLTTLGPMKPQRTRHSPRTSDKIRLENHQGFNLTFF